MQTASRDHVMPSEVVTVKQTRVIVVHVGALRGYALPAAFANVGMLEAFYTDLCADRGFGRVAAALSLLPYLGSRFRRLANRVPPPGVMSRTHTFDLPALRGQLEEIGVKDNARLSRVRRRCWAAMGDAMCRIGVGQATHVLSVYGHGHAFLAEAHRQGLSVVCDVNIAVSAPEILRSEYARFPDWGGLRPDVEQPGFPNTMLRYGDLFLCPSEFVRNDLIEKHGVAPERTRLVPYAVADCWLDLECDPEPGCVLFAGEANLRKGIHYFCKAAKMLGSEGSRYRFRVVGGVRREIREHPESGSVEFTGRIPRTEMPNEFARADVLVLPSLAEGSAGVTYEALGCGIPVVATLEAGSVVQHGVEGLIVPSRDPTALAAAIAEIVDNRELRARMSRAARKRASEFTWSRFRERVVDALVGVNDYVSI